MISSSDNAGVEAGLFQDAGNGLHQVFLIELAHREVDRHPDRTQPRLLPGPGLGAGGAQHPFADGDDKAVLLGERDELHRAEQPAFGMAPAHQRLDADDLAACQVDLRLVVQYQFVALDGAAQRAFQGQLCALAPLISAL